MALSSASGPSSSAPVIWPRSAILHSAAASSVDGTLALMVSIALRIATRTSWKPIACARSIAFCTMSTLCIQIRRNVHRGVGDDQRIGMSRHVQDEAVADAPRGADAVVAGNHRAHHLVGVQAAFHQRFSAARAHQRHRLVQPSRGYARTSICKAADIEPGSPLRPRGASPRSHQDRRDQSEPCRLDR